MLIIILAVIGLSILILGHEAGHFFVAKFFGLKIDEFGFGFPPRIFARKKGETEYSLNWLPFGGFVRIAGENDPAPFSEEKGATQAVISEADKKRLFSFQPAWKKAVVIVAGVATNFIIGWFLISAVLMIGAPKILAISDIQKNSPAERAGLAAGDILVGYADSKSFIDFVDFHRGQPTVFTVLRNGKDVNFTIAPRTETGPDEGALGVLLVESGESRQGFFAAIANGLKSSLQIAILTVAAFYDLIKNLVFHGSLLPDVVGPVGIFSIAEEAGRIGLIYLVRLVSLISLNLAVVNLVPFPALDGGRLFLIAIEKIKRSPVSRRTEAWVNTFGFALLIVLMVLLTVRDVGRWF